MRRSVARPLVLLLAGLLLASAAPVSSPVAASDAATREGTRTHDSPSKAIGGLLRLSMLVPGTPIYGVQFEVATPDSRSVFVHSSGSLGPNVATSWLYRVTDGQPTAVVPAPGGFLHAKGTTPDGAYVVVDSMRPLTPDDVDASTPDLFLVGPGGIQRITIGVDAATGAFRHITEDGSEVVFTSGHALLPEDHDVFVDVYRWTSETDDLALLTPDTSVDVTFAGISADGSRLLVKSDEALAGDAVDDGLYEPGPSGYVLRGAGHLVRMSADGSQVFSNTGAALTTDDIYAEQDGFLSDDDGLTLLTPAEEFGAGISLVSDDGSRWAISTSAALTVDDLDAVEDTFLLRDGGYELITQGDEPATATFVSDDGTVAAYQSTASLAPGDTDEFLDLYRWDASDPEHPVLLTPGTSVDAVGVAGASADGETLILETNGRLLPADTDIWTDVYVWRYGSLTLASPDGDGSLDVLLVADDARRILFETGRSLLPEDINGAQDVYVVDLDLDTTSPKATVPTSKPRAATNLSSGRITTRIAWTGSDVGSGVARYELAQRTDSGAWTTVSTNLTSPTIDRPLAPGHTYAFRVRAVDGANLTSAWATGTVFRVTGYSELSSAVKYSGTWSSTASTAYWGGKAKSSTRAGAKAVFTFTGRSLAVVSRLGPGRGKAEIWIGTTKMATVDLYSASYSSQRVIWSGAWTTSAKRTVTIKVLGTNGRPRVEVDGFVVGS